MSFYLVPTADAAATAVIAVTVVKSTKLILLFTTLAHKICSDAGKCMHCQLMNYFKSFTFIFIFVYH